MKRLSAFDAALCLLAASLPFTAEAATYVTGSYSYDYELVLGDGITCGASSATLPCRASGVSVNSMSPLTISPRLSNGPGNETAHVSFEPDHALGFRGLETEQWMRAYMTDAVSGPHRTAAAIDASFHSRMVVDMTTPLRPDETAVFEISFRVGSRFDLLSDVVWSAAFRVNDLTTGETLASFSGRPSRSLEIDFETIANHQLELLFDAEFSTHQPPGFSNSDDLFRRGFDFDVRAETELVISSPPPPYVPEPGTAALLGLGLIALARRRC